MENKSELNLKERSFLLVDKNKQYFVEKKPENIFFCLLGIQES